MVRFAVVVTLAGVLSASVIAPVVRAQQSSGITGIVKDTSGAILPGVTVEAASSSLIEKSRSAVTDEQGRFNIVDLVPGTYTVTFTLTGFNAIKREGIILTSGFTALWPPKNAMISTPASVEGWNQVTPAHYISRIDKTESKFIRGFYEANFGQARSTKS